MKVYLVGGAVRDELLDREVQERDWVVVGASESTMLELNYQQVGKDFPVFLHPKTKEEYALVRNERKVAVGYKGFKCDFSEKVTLEEDLKRRDLTINAIAKNLDTNELIDPYNGQQDCQKKVLRHVSEAFREDPLRLLRLARFAARFPDFSIAPETWQMALEMVKAGELADLTPERVLAEVHKALKEPSCDRFFAILDDLNADTYLWPWMNSLRTQSALITASNMNLPAWQKLVLITYLDIETFIKRYPLTAEQISLAKLLNRHSKQWVGSYQWCAKDWADFFQTVDAYRRPNRLKVVINLLETFQPNMPNFSYIEPLYKVCLDIPSQIVDPDSNLKGKAYGQALLRCRIERIQSHLDWLEKNKKDNAD